MGLEGFDFVENAQVPRNDWSAAAKQFLEEKKAMEAAARAGAKGVPPPVQDPGLLRQMAEGWGRKMPWLGEGVESASRAAGRGAEFASDAAGAATRVAGQGARFVGDAAGAATRAAEAVGTGVGKGVSGAVRAAESLGTAVGNKLVPAAIKSLNFTGALPHAAMYFDDDVPLAAKIGVGAGDLARAGGSALGYIAGAKAGAKGGFAGRLAAGAAGSFAGDQAAEWAADKLGYSDTLRKYGYDRDIVDSIKAAGQKDWKGIFGKNAPLDITTPQTAVPGDSWHDAGQGRGMAQDPRLLGMAPPAQSQSPGPQATPADAQYAAREAARFADQAKQSTLPLRDQGPTGPAVPGGIAVARQPNGVLEFSGTDVKGPVSYDGAGAAGFRPSGTGVNSMPAAGFMSGSNGSALSMPEYSDVIRAKLAAMQDAQEASLRQSGPVARHSGNDWQARIDLRNLETSASSNSASPETKKAYAEARQLDQLAKAGADPNTLARIQAATSNYGHDAQLLGTKYAADQGLRGHQFTAQNQYRVGQQEFFQKQQDRTLMHTLMQMSDDNPRKAADLATKAGRPDLGNLLLDNYEKGIKASSSVTTGNDAAFKNVLDTVLKTVPDRDANKDARYARSLQAHMGNEIARLEEYVTKHPGDKDSADQLTRLRRRDMSVMEGNSEAMLRFSLGMRLKDMAEKNHGIMPWAGTTVMQDEPVRYISKEVIPASVAGVNLPGHRGFYRTNRGDLIPVADVENDPLFSISPPHSNTFATMKR